MAPDSRFIALAALPIAERNTTLLELADEGEFDFIDLGTHKGAGLELGLRLGGQLGLGVERNSTKAEALLGRGFAVYTGDVMSLPTPRRRFRFAVCRHILEHLPNEYLVGAVVWKLQQLCTRFLYIEGPDFSTEPYLQSVGLTMAHTTMPTHTCHLLPDQLRRMLRSFDVEGCLEGGLHPIEGSLDPWVHAAGSVPDRAKWKPGEDRPKPDLVFPVGLYRDFAMFVDLHGSTDLVALGSRIKHFQAKEGQG